MVPSSDSEIDAIVAYIPSLSALGVKWVGSFPENYNRKLPQTTAVLIMNDVETGLPVAILDATQLTALRTAAVTAISASHLAREDSQVLGIIGCGVQGRSNLLALNDIFGFSEIKVYDIRMSASQEYIEEMMPLVDKEVKLMENPKEVVIGSDIVVTATATLSKPAPFIEDSWLGSGTLAVPLDVDSAWQWKTIKSVNKFVTDTWDHVEAYSHHGCFPYGLPSLYVELGQIVAGIKPGRERKDERIMVMNTGMAIEDVSVGKNIYDRAQEKGVGLHLPYLT